MKEVYNNHFEYNPAISIGDVLVVYRVPFSSEYSLKHSFTEYKVIKVKKDLVRGLSLTVKFMQQYIDGKIYSNPLFEQCKEFDILYADFNCHHTEIKPPRDSNLFDSS